MDTENFKTKAILVHGKKYDYSKSNYINSKTKLIIICKKHGEFLQTPHTHLSKCGCQICASEKGQKNITDSTNKRRLTFEMFVDKANEKHLNKYTYYKTDIKNIYQKIKINCHTHGDFYQVIGGHLAGHGCTKCHLPKRGLSQKNTINKFIEKANKIHNNKYDYSETIYQNSQTKIKIICPLHGLFSQIPNSHLNGNGCPFCKDSKGEFKIKKYLETFGIRFKRQKTFDGCKGTKLLQFDFYLLDHNSCIEFDGLQHFKPIEYFGGVEAFLKLQKHDKIKTEYCKQNNIPLLRIKYNEKIEHKLNIFLFRSALPYT